ncbi:hypothetical protein GE09DRAFT_751219 [Coniochaeta sp. 2T2.1]|nr:hypothetical protein GE09DRAFT_751219 [Coniochaeta sp. 2T2.1]
MRFCFTNAGPTSGAYSTTEYPSRFKVTPYPCTGGSDEDRTFYIYRDAVGHSPLQVRLSTPIGTQIYTPLNCHGSFAPLSNVIRASTFTDPRRGYYRGLLFHYSNGGQRALGQCRVGFDPMSEFRNPATLCFRVGLSTDGLQRAWVGLGDVEHDHDERHTCYQMGRGRLGFWTEPRGITGLDVVGGRLVGE